MSRFFRIVVVLSMAWSVAPVLACGPAPREHYAKTEKRVRERFESVDSVMLVTLLSAEKVKKTHMEIEVAGERTSFMVDRVFKGRARPGDKLVFDTYSTCATYVVEKWDGSRGPVVSARQWLIYRNESETQMPPHDMAQPIEIAAYDVKVLSQLVRTRADKPR